MKKFLLKSTLLVALLIAFTTSYGQNTTADCPKKGTADCPIANCPLQGTPDCPLVNCPLKGTPDCPFNNGLKSQSSSTAKGDRKLSKKPVVASFTSKTSVAIKKTDADLPPCCRKEVN